mmetsp:Transcript_11325/g.21324  ORF Transcript_11325/g.21324 Transcript_11325/m.21324 type:complete len:286 (+) Transcript_11325:70-927(+)
MFLWIAFLSSAVFSAGLNLRSTSTDLSAKIEQRAVNVLIEPGCDHCRAFMIGPLKAAVADEKTAKLMDVDVVSFGNSYWAVPECENANATNVITPGCGGGGGYDVGRRQCYNEKCFSGATVTDPPEDCYAGTLVYQFGFVQMYSTQYFLCAKHLAKNSWQTYVPFIICMEEDFENIHDGASTVEVAKNCASSNNMDYSKLESCYNSDVPKTMLRQEAASVPTHPGVPYVTINGVEVELEVKDSTSLISAIHSAKDGSNETALLEHGLVSQKSSFPALQNPMRMTY